MLLLMPSQFYDCCSNGRATTSGVAISTPDLIFRSDVLISSPPVAARLFLCLQRSQVKLGLVRITAQAVTIPTSPSSTSVHDGCSNGRATTSGVAISTPDLTFKLLLLLQVLFAMARESLPMG